MKKIIMFAIVFFSLNLFAGETIDIMVKGMVCSFCSQGITKKFKEQPSVKEVNVNLDTHLVKLELKDNKKIENLLIENILKEAGYGVESITRK